MQELIEELESIKNYKYKELTIRLVKEKLDKEKEQIIEAHKSGWIDCQQHIMTIGETTRLGEAYYNQTYNQKIPELLYKDGTPMRKVKLGKEAQELLNEIEN